MNANKGLARNVLYEYFLAKRHVNDDGGQLLMAGLATLTQQCCAWVGRWCRQYYKKDYADHNKDYIREDHPILWQYQQWCGQLVDSVMNEPKIQKFCEDRARDLFKRKFKLTSTEQECIIYDDLPHAATKRWKVVNPHG